MNRVETAINRSASVFRDNVWPHIADQLDGGELVPIETVTDSRIAFLLDTLGMTDAWQIVNQQSGIRGLSTRVQWTTRPYCTWTIRTRLPSGAATEYHKLMRDGQWQRPHYIIQAYVDHDNQLLEAAAITADDLRGLVAQGHHGPEKTNPVDGNRFIAVDWLRAQMYGSLAAHIRVAA